MADTTKYGKYIISHLKENIVEAPWSPPVSKVEKDRGGRLLFLDDEVVKGAFYLECVWIVPPSMLLRNSRTGERAFR